MNNHSGFHRDSWGKRAHLFQHLCFQISNLIRFKTCRTAHIHAETRKTEKHNSVWLRWTKPKINLCTGESHIFNYHIIVKTVLLFIGLWMNIFRISATQKIVIPNIWTNDLTSHVENICFSCFIKFDDPRISADNGLDNKMNPPPIFTRF